MWCGGLAGEGQLASPYLFIELAGRLVYRPDSSERGVGGQTTGFPALRGVWRLRVALQDVFRLAVSARLHGQQTINTFYYQQTAGAGSAGFALAANLSQAVLAADWWPAYIDLHSDDWTVEKFAIQQLANTSPNGILSPTYEIDVVDVVGTQLGDSVTSSVAVVVRRRTETPGRSGMGRIYLAGFPAQWTLTSRINTDVVAYQQASDEFLANINVDLVNAGLTWSPRHFAAKQATLKATTIRSWTIDTVLRNQRRRQLGVGV